MTITTSNPVTTVTTDEQTIAGSGSVATDGYLYILVNQYVPTLVKIGYTDRDPHVRAVELSGTTGVPGRWTVRHYWLLENAFQWEQRVFAALSQHREIGEFFNLSCDIAIARIDVFLLQAGAIDASGISAAARRELSRQEAARKREEQKILDKQQEQIAEQQKQQQFDAAWEQGWPNHIQPWRKLVHFCGEQMKTYSRPGILHKIAKGDINLVDHFLTYVFESDYRRRRLRAIAPNDLVPHLRKWSGYPRLLALLPEMFAASRRAREFIFCLDNQYGRRTPSKRIEDWQLLCYGHERPEIMLEIRLATQSVLGLSGDEATALLQSEPTTKSALMALAKNHGQGTYTYPDGGKYVGEWSDGKHHGQGTYTWPDGQKYVGGWNDGKHHGQGTYTWPDGQKYVGEWRDGKRNGQGTLTSPDGMKYVGEWRDGKYHGQGPDAYPDGGKYVGEIKDDKRSGHGTYTFPDGGKYVGEIKDGKRNGHGTYTWPDGRKYVGEFRHDQLDGQGTDTYPDGMKFVGGWRNGKPNGQGTVYRADGTILQSGNWGKR